MLRASLLAIGLALCVFVALGSAPPAAAQPFLSGGKHTSAAWNNIDVSSGTGALEVTVPFRGKRNSFVIVHFGASANNFIYSCDIQATIGINGTSPSGTVSTAQMPDCTGKSCDASGTAYFDLDQLEEDQPGAFIRRELTIRMNVARISGDCPSAPGQFIAQLVKK